MTNKTVEQLDTKMLILYHDKIGEELLKRENKESMQARIERLQKNLSQMAKNVGEESNRQITRIEELEAVVARRERHIEMLKSLRDGAGKLYEEVLAENKRHLKDLDRLGDSSAALIGRVVELEKENHRLESQPTYLMRQEQAERIEELEAEKEIETANTCRSIGKSLAVIARFEKRVEELEKDNRSLKRHHSFMVRTSTALSKRQVELKKENDSLVAAEACRQYDMEPGYCEVHYYLMPDGKCTCQKTGG